MQDHKTPDTVFILPAEDGTGVYLMAVGVEAAFHLDVMSSEKWTELDSWIELQQDWVFGWITYDAKNSIEKLESRHKDALEFPQLFFFVPQHLFKWNGAEREVLKGAWSEQFNELLTPESTQSNSAIDMHARVSKEAYIEAITTLQQHIHYGDIYEVNYCQEFFAERKLSDPFSVWHKLRSFTNAPFSAFVRHENLHVMCASPERFIRKKGNKIISQPIKGTIRRGETIEEDELLKQILLTSKKDRSENIMIVDLVRNDLSKFSERGSVKVEELCGIHTFQTVHHLISTISAEVKTDTTFSQIIRDTFPMGSMTGAPKIRAMQLIDEIELSARGLYSGTIGYITPDGDFDFNVVIRSLLYNDSKPYLSYSVGGAITALSDPEGEFEECRLKADALMRTLK